MKATEIVISLFSGFHQRRLLFSFMASTIPCPLIAVLPDSDVPRRPHPVEMFCQCSPSIRRILTSRRHRSLSAITQRGLQCNDQYRVGLKRSSLWHSESVDRSLGQVLRRPHKEPCSLAALNNLDSYRRYPCPPNR